MIFPVKKPSKKPIFSKYSIYSILFGGDLILFLRIFLKNKPFFSYNSPLTAQNSMFLGVFYGNLEISSNLMELQ